jgi:hypothetical protein
MILMKMTIAMRMMIGMKMTIGMLGMGMTILTTMTTSGRMMMKKITVNLFSFI